MKTKLPTKRKRRKIKGVRYPTEQEATREAGQRMADAIDRLERDRDDCSLEDCLLAKSCWDAVASAWIKTARTALS